jgi:hypothetical protein
LRLGKVSITDLPWRFVVQIATAISAGVIAGLLLRDSLAWSLVAIGISLILIFGYAQVWVLTNRITPITAVPDSVERILNERLPPIAFIDSEAGTGASMLAVVQGAQRFIATTGGKSRAKPYLDAIEGKVRKDGAIYTRIIFEKDGINHVLCEHLCNLLSAPAHVKKRVQIGFHDTRSNIGYFTVTEAGVIIFMPDPTSSQITRCLHVSTLPGGDRPVVEALKDYITSHLWGQAQRLRTPEDVRRLCKVCGRKGQA